MGRSLRWQIGLADDARGGPASIASTSATRLPVAKTSNPREFLTRQSHKRSDADSSQIRSDAAKRCE